MNSLYLHRQQTNSLRELLLEENNRNVILIEGARQVGKTTLIKNCLNNFPAVFSTNLEVELAITRDIDRTSSFEEFSRLLSAYFKAPQIDQAGCILFIDEAQESEKLGQYVRSMKEQWQHARVVLTGSSMNRIFRKDQRIPVGRYQSLLITPFTFEEFLGAASKPHLSELYNRFSSEPSEQIIEDAFHQEFLVLLDKYLEAGGLPAVVTAYFAGRDFRALRQSIFDAQEDDFVRKSSLTERAYFKAGTRGKLYWDASKDDANT